MILSTASTNVLIEYIQMNMPSHAEKHERILALTKLIIQILDESTKKRYAPLTPAEIILFESKISLLECPPSSRYLMTTILAFKTLYEDMGIVNSASLSSLTLMRKSLQNNDRGLTRANKSLKTLTRISEVILDKNLLTQKQQPFEKDPLPAHSVQILKDYSGVEHLIDAVKLLNENDKGFMKLKAESLQVLTDRYLRPICDNLFIDLFHVRLESFDICKDNRVEVDVPTAFAALENDKVFQSYQQNALFPLYADNFFQIYTFAVKIGAVGENALANVILSVDKEDNWINVFQQPSSETCLNSLLQPQDDLLVGELIVDRKPNKPLYQALYSSL